MANLEKPITTQEELDQLITDRLSREREAAKKRYADYDELKTKAADYEKRIAELTGAAEAAAKKYRDYDKTLADLQTKVHGYETDSVKTRIAHETGLPWGMASRLAGESEEDIRKDAEALKQMIGSQTPTAPSKSTETEPAGGDKAAMRTLLAGLKKQE